MAKEHKLLFKKQSELMPYKNAYHCKQLYLGYVPTCSARNYACTFQYTIWEKNYFKIELIIILELSHIVENKLFQ
jgi:hypothetical protein